MDQGPNVAVVIPAYNAASYLPRTLLAACAALGDARVLVVDPGSTDDTSEVARAHGADVVRLPERAGPARARNVGVDHVEAEVVLFIDSDCVAHSDVVERVRAAFAADPELVSISGSYDADPAEHGFFSQYMNLRHHYTHQTARTDGSSFWAGCGAVRRSAFLEVGGFDEARFPTPMIEDIELGLRLARVGRTRLDPELQVTHLKRWSLRSVVETDIRFRALPWARLILETSRFPDDLNLRWSQRIAAAVAPFALFSFPVLTWAALSGRRIAAVLWLGPAVLSLLLHRDQLRFFTRVRGAWFAVRFWLFHQVYLTYSGATMLLCAVGHLLRRRSSSISSSGSPPVSS
jgi:glycosyltransferase involved in cell wall biosynthesis